VAFQVVDELAVDSFVGAVNAQPWTFCGSAYFIADTHVQTFAALLFSAIHFGISI
jgi:hypothetical protein